MSDKSSRFPSISSDDTTCYPKEVSIILTILSKPDEHPLIVSISPYPPRPVDRDVYRPYDDHPFIGLGDNLTSGTKYELWKGNQVLVQTKEQASQEEGEGLIVFVPYLSLRMTGLKVDGKSWPARMIGLDRILPPRLRRIR
ncbi:hypothetical protein V866_000145 [Kwoniella sp. B9012]|uniref:Uncharacterized protein n=1 Tax=Kwoniella europaea PYCC6329 TaxID=1423913 RepID=A0AAX4K7G8_9TREE